MSQGEVMPRRPQYIDKNDDDCYITALHEAERKVCILSRLLSAVLVSQFKIQGSKAADFKP